MTGKDIFKQRAALRRFSRNPDHPISDAAEMNASVENPFTAAGTVRKVTEIQITTERARSPAGIVQSTCSEADSRSSFSSTRKFAAASTSASHLTEPAPVYSAGPEEPLPDVPASPTRAIHDSDPMTQCTTTVTGGIDPRVLVMAASGNDLESRVRSAQQNPKNAAIHANSAAWGYAKVALLMFLAMFIVWVGHSCLFVVPIPRYPSAKRNFFSLFR